VIPDNARRMPPRALNQHCVTLVRATATLSCMSRDDDHAHVHISEPNRVDVPKPSGCRVQFTDVRKDTKAHGWPVIEPAYSARR